MKNTINIFVLAVILVIAQACGKSDKNKEEVVASETPAVSVAATTLTPAEKRAKLEKLRAERAEARRIAYEERYRLTPSYTDSEGYIVYYKAEVNPSFVGGDDAMSKYFNDNLVYPKEAEEKGVEGTVFVDFVVAPDGVVRQVTATDAAGEDVDQSLRDEAVRVVSSMPKWIAGRQHGKPVYVSYNLPVTFQLR